MRSSPMPLSRFHSFGCGYASDDLPDLRDLALGDEYLQQLAKGAVLTDCRPTFPPCSR